MIDQRNTISLEKKDAYVRCHAREYDMDPIGFSQKAGPWVLAHPMFASARVGRPGRLCISGLSMDYGMVCERVGRGRLRAGKLLFERSRVPTGYSVQDA